jgi:hypothetical protein
MVFVGRCEISSGYFSGVAAFEETDGSNLFNYV